MKSVKLILMLFLKAWKQFRSSMFIFHAIVFVITFFIYYIFKKYSLDQKTWATNYVDMLNTIGILSAFYIFALDKLNFGYLASKYPKKQKAYRKWFCKEYVNIPQGEIIINTCLSMVVIEVLLLGIQYLSFIFQKMSVGILILSIVYLVVGFVVLVGIWHGTELSINRDERENTKHS